jgi:hypothetical protein
MGYSFELYHQIFQVRKMMVMGWKISYEFVVVKEIFLFATSFSLVLVPTQSLPKKIQGTIFQTYIDHKWSCILTSIWF